jgi:hypothetical protein
VFSDPPNAVCITALRKPNERVAVPDAGMVIYSEAETEDRWRYGARTPTPPVERCPHLGAPIDGDAVSHTVTGCNGISRRVTLQVFGCDLHGRCLPNYACSKSSLESNPEGDWPEALCYQCPDAPKATKPR